jgi:hypothetical protein
MSRSGPQFGLELYWQRTIKGDHLAEDAKRAVLGDAVVKPRI